MFQFINYDLCCVWLHGNEARGKELYDTIQLIHAQMINDAFICKYELTNYLHAYMFMRNRRHVLVSLVYYSKVPQTGAFSNRILFSHDSGDWKSKIKVPADSIPDEEPAFWLEGGCLLVVSPYGKEIEL